MYGELDPEDTAEHYLCGGPANIPSAADFFLALVPNSHCLTVFSWRPWPLRAAAADR
jgi:hypothetical protein